MTSNLPTNDIQKIIIDSLSSTKDGVGIFDKDDLLVFCNKTMAALFGLSQEAALNKSFSELCEHSFNSDQGVNIEAPSLEEWLEYTSLKRRSCQFRTFETDTKEGKFFLVTEQIVHEDFLYTYLTDITEKKENENKLKALTKKLIKLASTDSLTNINNRRSFYEKSETEFNRSLRQQLPLSLLIIDLDNFKKVNDNFCHAAGDAVLKSFAKSVQLFLRQYDIFGRIGGEEFALLMPNTNLDSALIIAERIRKNVADECILLEDHKLNISISIGLTEKTSLTSSIEEMLHQADKNLYKAKVNGKNQTSTIS
jgi:diguanylate cyclase (GGDEF)-like protein